jgi:2-polyprenyl-6-methoxyphenol hydroxylase-like FAD-dependent oxidoreductase
MTLSAAQQPVLIAGGGIGGMSLALTLHQIGVPCVVFEAVADPQPLGVGIKRDAFMARYKAAARFAIETLNAAPPTIAPELGSAVGRVAAPTLT